MEAGIEFNVYKNFDQFVKFNGLEYDYSVALKELNKLVKELVDNNKLSFTYKKKPVKILLPIDELDCGNIFDKDSYCGYCWEGVAIFCEIPDDEDNFESEKLKVKKIPDYFEPERVIW